MLIQTTNLKPGQEIGLANCSTPATVVKREGKNLYRVSWKGSEVVLPRNHIAVKRDGRFQFGPVNAD
jgi:hypothetical protein